MTNPAQPPSSDSRTDSTSSWIAYHLYYHEDRDRALNALVHPLLAELWGGGTIDHFFFLRYDLGGPHLRLRVRPVVGREDRATAAIEQAADAFFASTPSTRSLDPVDIARRDTAILASDPNEHSSAVHPDNSWSREPFRPEVERYGGAELLDASIDFFAVSSLAALHHVDAEPGAPRGRQLPRMGRQLVRLAHGLARNASELAELLEGPGIFWRREMAAILERAEKMYHAQQDVFRRLVLSECEALRADTEHRILLTAAARRLRLEIHHAAPPVRRRIAGSQLHLLANRLGLGNPEEVYLTRILWLAIRDLLEAEHSLLETPVEEHRNLREILSECCADLDW